MTIREKKTYMEHCFELAVNAKGWVSPNPMVGCVIVNKGKIVGEGFHHRYGGPHAEIHALRRAGVHALGATVFINLEPCSHFGKTPPCTDALISAGVKEVIIGVKDPNPLVHGNGIKQLKKAGIIVESGFMQDEAKHLNEKFFYFMDSGLPFIAVKVAQTIDGRIADLTGLSKWITSLESRKESHRLRSQFDAILVGANTVRKDNPELTVRFVRGRNPLRVVLDGQLSAPVACKIFKTKSAPTIVLTTSTAMQKNIQKILKLERQGVQVFAIGKDRYLPATSVLKFLAMQGISSVLIEGGARTITTMMESEKVQKIFCFIAPLILGSGIPGFLLKELPLGKALRLNHVLVRQIGMEVLIEGSLGKNQE